MLKSILLGSVAGLVVVAGAQAADLPVKAKPVEYVKVCSLYGAGFWYVPGTDTCLKIGSYIRVQTDWDAGNGGIPVGFGDTSAAAAGRFDRTDTSDLSFRTRASISVDLRTQTEYGTLRSYLELGAQMTTLNSGTAADAPFFDRGFIQFAGLTAGRIRSYFDINSFAPYSYSNNRVSGDTGSAGIYGIAYTGQFGNGVTGTISLEDGGSGSNGNSMGSSGSRGRMVSDLSVPGVWGLGTISYDNGGWRYPDVVGALRVDQAWGYAQVAAAAHEVSGAYYLTPDLDSNASPASRWGWATTAGFTLNDVLGLRGDQFGVQGAYSQGAAGYVTRATGPFQVYSSNTNIGAGWITDGVFDNPVAAGHSTDIQLTTVWGINGFYQHFWNPKWRTSLYGGYVAVSYNAEATALLNTHLGGATGNIVCGVPVANAVTVPVGGNPLAGNSCSPNFSWWQVGTRTQWNPHPDLDIGVDVLWSHLNTAYKGPVAAISPNGAQPACTTAGSVRCALDDQDVLSVMFRIQRNFLP